MAFNKKGKNENNNETIDKFLNYPHDLNKTTKKLYNDQYLHKTNSTTENTDKIPLNYYNEPESQPKPKKKSRKTIFNFFVSIILIYSVLFSILTIAIYSMCAETDYVPDSLHRENFSEFVASVSSTYNVLIIGTDKNTDGTSRSDTIMLVNINKVNNKVNLISFLRDLWVDIPGHESSKLNSAYSLGGAELLIETIKYNFDIEIHDYVQVDFQMFVEIIDQINGVTVNITEKEAEFINRTTRQKVEVGKNTLNGEEALVYCRIRKLDSDFMRTYRQRKVITSIIEKIKSQNAITTLNIARDVLPLIRTNISPFKMTFLSFSIPSAINFELTQMRIPVDDSFSSEYINGQSVIVPDIELNKNKLHTNISS